MHCSPALLAQTAHGGSGRRCSRLVHSLAGASGRLPRARPATTRCPTTTVRCGRTTMRWSPSASRATGSRPRRCKCWKACLARRRDAGPTAYPLACAPQAWSAASVFALLAAALGISFVPSQQQIRFFRPTLPAWLAEVRLTNLRLGEASIDLALRRDGNAVASDVTRREGPIEIVMAY